MRGKKRTKRQKHELFEAIEPFLVRGYSLKKSCELALVPYSSIRDAIKNVPPLRTKTLILQNKVNTKAVDNIIKSIEAGNVADSKWWLNQTKALESEKETELPQQPSPNVIVFKNMSSKRADSKESSLVL